MYHHDPGCHLCLQIVMFILLITMVKLNAETLPSAVDTVCLFIYHQYITHEALVVIYIHNTCLLYTSDAADE